MGTNTIRKPNILLILVDDMGYSDLGCYGSSIHTPNLDKLTANGLQFTDFYCTPRCCPSRAAVLTGLTPHKAGVGWMNFNWPAYVDPLADGYAGTLSRNSVTIAEALRPAGYKTYISGKWHLSAEMADKNTWPTARGFDRSFSCIAGGTDYFKPQFLTLDNSFYKANENCYFTDLIGDFASNFINEHFNLHNESPFFMYLAFTAPHFPIQAPKERVDKYKGCFDHGYEVENRQRYNRMIELGLIKPQWEVSPRPKAVPEWSSLPKEEQYRLARIMETYAAMVEIMDENVGKVVKVLEENAALENTLILFLSDNGACAEAGISSKNDKIGQDWAYVQNTPFKLFKHNTMQGGVQTPFIAHWPAGIKKCGSIVHESTGCLYDIMPTCLELADADYPAVYEDHIIHPFDGQSLVPILNGIESMNRRDIYIEHEGNAMLRRGDYKVVRQLGELWQLYDMNRDRSESHDLSKDKKHLESFIHMVKDYIAWADANHVLPGELTRVYERIHGYGTYNYIQEFIDAMERESNL